jgi:hypothetical protein
MSDWPFDQPPNCAVITLRQIVDGSQPILRVTHDSDDHGWQFLAIDDARVEDAAVVSLQTILNVDPSLVEVADLPPGWHAWRPSITDAWMRSRNSR